MSKKTFNPNDWLGKSKSEQTTLKTPYPPHTRGQEELSDIEVITRRIESSATDIAPNYADWRDLGFALADALGESGRSYYHRLSRFYSGYTEKETDRQFDNCLKSRGHGVTIKTLYHLAKTAGVDVAVKKSFVNNVQKTAISPNSSKSPTEEIEDIEYNAPETMPTFSDEIKENLPDFLQQVVVKSNSPEDADLLLLGSITAISACLPNVYGIYAEREIFPNLFLFVTAQASAGKGRLTLCRKLVEPIHRQLREINKAEYEDYKRKQAEYVANKKDPDAEQPEEPPLRTLFIPANSSATAVFQILNDNKGVGLMFETEGDTLAQTFKSEHGNYSDGFRKAFHHETISYNRRKDREFVELNVPKLSTVLSGTPRQIQTLIPDAENGLFSRFIFYCMNVHLVWNDVFLHSDTETLDSFFERLGNQFFDLYKFLQQSQSIKFSFTKKQQTQFNKFFNTVQMDYAHCFGLDIVASIRRLGLIAFRVSMILSTLRVFEHGSLSYGGNGSVMVCTDEDFQSTMTMIKTLLIHTSKVYKDLIPPVNTALSSSQPTKIRQRFCDSLPAHFDRQTYLSIAKQLNIPEKTADKYIKSFCLKGAVNHEAHGKYQKM
jgi:hypothetical protein